MAKGIAREAAIAEMLEFYRTAARRRELLAPSDRQRLDRRSPRSTCTPGPAMSAAAPSGSAKLRGRRG